MTRTFIALEMNETLQRYLGGIIHQVAPVLSGLRWVDPQGIHITLAFLGEIDQTQLAAATAAVRVTAQQASAFTYRLTRLNIFGTERQPRVLWMGIEETSGALQRLHRALQQQLEQRGFSTDQRPFAPHLTLARVKAREPLPAEAQAYLHELLSGTSAQFLSTPAYPAAHVHLVKSELTSVGAKYTILATYALL